MLGFFFSLVLFFTYIRKKKKKSATEFFATRRYRTFDDFFNHQFPCDFPLKTKKKSPNEVCFKTLMLQYRKSMYIKAKLFKYDLKMKFVIATTILLFHATFHRVKSEEFLEEFSLRLCDLYVPHVVFTFFRQFVQRVFPLDK